MYSYLIKHLKVSFTSILPFPCKVRKVPNISLLCYNNVLFIQNTFLFLIPSLGDPLLKRLLDPLGELDVFRDAKLLQPRRIHRGVVWPLRLECKQTFTQTYATNLFSPQNFIFLRWCEVVHNYALFAWGCAGICLMPLPHLNWPCCSRRAGL